MNVEVVKSLDTGEKFNYIFEGRYLSEGYECQPKAKEDPLKRNPMHKILVADDDNRLYEILKHILGLENYSVIHAKDGEEVIKIVQVSPPDLILLDVMMPGIDGLEVCRRIRMDQRLSFIYIMMLTAKSGTDDEVTGLDIGADDYIVKPFNARALLARVRRGIRVMKEKQAATFDPLTRLYNRRTFEAFLCQEKEKFRRYKRPVSLIFMDLDRFKRINDTYGHQTGDDILKEISDIVRNNSRASDLPARWGGEELAILLPETDKKGAHILAEKLRKRIESHHFPGAGTVTASFGVSSMFSTECDVVASADQALYRAKEKGRNRIELC